MLYSMYEKRKNPREDSKGEELLLCVSAVAAPGSVFILQFMEDIENNSSAALSQGDATATLEENGWDNLIFSRYGDETLNYGRFPTDKFKSSASFSALLSISIDLRASNISLKWIIRGLK